MAKFMCKYLFRACGHLFRGLKNFLSLLWQIVTLWVDWSVRLPKGQECVEICFQGLYLLSSPMILVLNCYKTSLRNNNGEIYFRYIFPPSQLIISEVLRANMRCPHKSPAPLLDFSVFSWLVSQSVIDLQTLSVAWTHLLSNRKKKKERNVCLCLVFLSFASIFLGLPDLFLCQEYKNNFQNIF